MDDITQPGGRPPAGGPIPTGSSVDAAGEQESQKGLLGSVKEKTTSQLNTQKARATAQLDQIADNVRRSTERLRAERHDVVATALERAVDQLERFSAQLRDRDMDELVADLERFGRRRPVLFLGTSFAAGLMLARFAKASSDAARPRGHAGTNGGRPSGAFGRSGPAGQERQ